MERTKISVTYQRTHNLGNYSNVRPAITIEAIPGEGEDVETIKAALMAEAREFIHATIDEALESDGQPAKFSTEPRYRLSFTQTELYIGDWGSRTKLTAPENLLVLTPTEIKLHKDGQQAARWWSEPWGVPHKSRLAAVHQAAAEWLEEHEGYRLIDCSDGDLSRIPAWAMEEPKAPEVPPVQPKPVTVRACDDYTPIGRDEDKENYATERAESQEQP